MTNKLGKLLLKGFLVVFSETGIIEELFKMWLYIFFLLSKGSVLCFVNMCD